MNMSVPDLHFIASYLQVHIHESAWQSLGTDWYLATGFVSAPWPWIGGIEEFIEASL